MRTSWGAWLTSPSVIALPTAEYWVTRIGGIAVAPLGYFAPTRSSALLCFFSGKHPKLGRTETSAADSNHRHTIGRDLLSATIPNTKAPYLMPDSRAVLFPVPYPFPSYPSLRGINARSITGGCPYHLRRCFSSPGSILDTLFSEVPLLMFRCFIADGRT